MLSNQLGSPMNGNYEGFGMGYGTERGKEYFLFRILEVWLKWLAKMRAIYTLYSKRKQTMTCHRCNIKTWPASNSNAGSGGGVDFSGHSSIKSIQCTRVRIYNVLSIRKSSQSRYLVSTDGQCGVHVGLDTRIILLADWNIKWFSIVGCVRWTVLYI